MFFKYRNLICFFLLSSFLMMPLCAQDESSDKDQGIAINFDNINIVEYIRFISKISGRNFIFDEAELDFSVTIISEEKTTVEETMAVLLQILRIRGISLIEQGNNFLIHRNASVSSFAHIVTNDGEPLEGQEENGEIVTRIFRLKNVKVGLVKSVITPVITPQASLETIEETDHLIITDYATNIEKISQLIHNIDRAENRLEVAQYKAQKIGVDELSTLAEKILVPLSRDETLILIPRSQGNILYIVSTTQMIEKSLKVLNILDKGQRDTGVLDDPLDLPAEERNPVTVTEIVEVEVPSIVETDPIKEGFEEIEDFADITTGTTQFHVYKLQHKRGNLLLGALQALSSNTPDGGGGIDSDLANSIQSIQWIETSNSFLFTGSSSSVRRVRALLEELDIPSKQVLIEVLILETTVDNSMNFGVEVGARGQSPSSSYTFSSIVPSATASPLPGALTAVNLADNPAANLMGVSEGLNLGVIGKSITHNGLGFSSLGSLIRAIHDDNTTDVVMTQKIITEDNVAAEVFVGTSTAIRGQAISSDIGGVITTNYEFRDVGTRMSVTPLLGPGDMITLEIDQEVSRAGDEPQDDVNTIISPVTTKSTTSTRVHVPNNYFVILSGMTQDEKINVRKRIPCLGALPFAGTPFKSDGKRTNKRNLMIFVRPTIIHTADEIEDVTKRQRQIWEDFNQNQSPLEYEIETGLEFLELKGLGLEKLFSKKKKKAKSSCEMNSCNPCSCE